MRIALAGWLHESNTFTPDTTEIQHFRESFLHHGEDLLPVWRDAHHELGGMIAGCVANGADTVPLMAAWATPRGPLTRATYETLVANLLERLAAAGPVDAMVLALHGAMVAEHLPSADSETIVRVRKVLGPNVPLVVSLDMHANIAGPMVHLPNVTVAYRTYPHVDQRDRGNECVTLATRAACAEIYPVQAAVKLPLLIHIVQQHTGSGVMAEVMMECARIATQPGMLSASVAPGYIYADTPAMGVTVVAVADRDRARAEAEAKYLAQFIFDRRDALNAGLLDTAEAVARAKSLEGTVCLMDSGDNIGAGGPGDSTVLFEAILRQECGPACVVLYDPAAAKACREAGSGATVSLTVGAASGAPHGRPVAVTGRVRHVGEGLFEETEPRHGGMRVYDQGLTAVVDTVEGHTLIVNSLRVMPTSLQQLLSVGVQPHVYKVITVKGVTAPRAAYDPIATECIPVDTPGVTQAGPEAFHYTRRPKPLYPLEEIHDWTPTLM